MGQESIIGVNMTKQFICMYENVIVKSVMYNQYMPIRNAELKKENGYIHILFSL